jgi:hypothetical protein
MQAGVLEYIVVVLRQRAVRWFVLQEGTFQERGPDEGGMLKSKVFSGLWLDIAALFQLDGLRVMEVLRQGVATSEHAAFVQQLQARRSAS